MTSPEKVETEQDKEFLSKTYDYFLENRKTAIMVLIEEVVGSI